MKILLSGATGLIGKEIGKLLVERGHEVLSLTRDQDRAKADLPFQTRILEWKGAGSPFPEDTLNAFSGLDAVINLMGENLSEGRWSPEVKERLQASRIQGTRELVSAVLKRCSPSVFIQGSAIGIYGSTPEGVVLDESGPIGKGFLPDLCQEWEAGVASLPRTTRTVILRTGVVISHQGGAFPKMLVPLLNGFGSVIGSGAQMMSLIHLSDVVRFIEHAIAHETIRGAYNLVAGEPCTQKQMVSRLCHWLNVGSGPGVPAFLVRAVLGEMSTLVLDSLAVRSTRLKEAGFVLSHPELDDILSEVTSWTLHPFHPKEPVFVKYTEQFVPLPLEEIFPFFSDAKNLEAITPEWLHFKIKKVSEGAMRRGTRIRYRLKVHGLPMRWLTDIAEWEPPTRFVDHQLKGPYSLWYHEHTFHPVKGGTLIRDWVRFQLPMGKVGRWVGFHKVNSDVTRIFHHRRIKILEKFGS